MLAKLGKVPAEVFPILPILVPTGRCYSLPSAARCVDQTVIASRSPPTCTASPVLFLPYTRLGARRCCVRDLPVLSLASASCRRHCQNSDSFPLSLTLDRWARVRVSGFKESEGDERGWGNRVVRWNGRCEPSPLFLSAYFILIFFYFCYYYLF